MERKERRKGGRERGERKKRREKKGRGKRSERENEGRRGEGDKRAGRRRTKKGKKRKKGRGREMEEFCAVVIFPFRKNPVSRPTYFHPDRHTSVIKARPGSVVRVLRDNADGV